MDIKVGSKTIRQLEVKLFVTSMLLQELLDEEELYRLAGLDKNMKASVMDILGEPEEDFDYEDEDY